MDATARRRQVVARATARARRAVVSDGLRRLEWEAATRAPWPRAPVLPAHVRAAEDSTDGRLPRGRPGSARDASHRTVAGASRPGRAPADTRRDVPEGR